MGRYAGVAAAFVLAVFFGVSANGSAAEHVRAGLPHFAVPARSASAAGVHKIRHIVVLVQENRSVDNLFNAFCVSQFVCADTVSVDPYRGIVLQPASLAARVSPTHSHKSFVEEFEGGAMTGFKKDYYAYVPAAETTVYRGLATSDGVLADEVFQPNMGASFPAHQYEIAGQAGGFSPSHFDIVANPKPHQGATCNARPKSRVQTVDMTSRYPGRFSSAFPCEDYATIFDRLSARGYTWRYYTRHDIGIWVPTQTVRHLFNSPNHVTPETRFIKDVVNGSLANVTYLTPDGRSSDHPGYVRDALAGPRWVASVVNAIGSSPFWSSTAVIVVWDDWGGWYDHVVPPLLPLRGSWPRWMGVPQPNEYGFRTPLIMVSPYAQLGTISHAPRSQAAILRFIETVFALPSLHTLDEFESDDLTTLLDLRRTPAPYVPVNP